MLSRWGWNLFVSPWFQLLSRTGTSALWHHLCSENHWLDEKLCWALNTRTSIDFVLWRTQLTFWWILWWRHIGSVVKCFNITSHKLGLHPRHDLITRSYHDKNWDTRQTHVMLFCLHKVPIRSVLIKIHTGDLDSSLFKEHSANTTCKFTVCYLQTCKTSTK